MRQKLKQLEATLRDQTSNLLAWSLAVVFICFGALKLFDISPVRDFVEATFSLFEHDLLFRLLGAAEVTLGIGLLWRRFRKYAALAICGHLAVIFVLSLLRPDLIFSAETLVTFVGEFVVKNFVLLAAAAVLAAEKDKKNVTLA